MPTHGLVPYRVGVREKGDTDNFWSLKNLYYNDNTIPQPDFIDLLESFLETYKGKLESNDEKTFLVRDYYREENIVEGIISVGDYGYEAELRDINTGDLTHRKDTTEAELLPFYFLFWIPKTKAGKLYEEGERGLMVFQSINGGSVKTQFSKRFNNMFIKNAENSMFSMKPVYSQEALEKLINARRIPNAKFEVDEMPSTKEGKMQLIEGMDSHDTEAQLIELKPKHGGSLTGLRKVAKQLKQDDGSFAEVVEDNVEDLSVEIINENGRRETIHPLDIDIKMKMELDPSSHNLSGGLPTTRFVSNRAQDLVNDVLPQGQVKTLSHQTKLSHVTKQPPANN